MTVLNSLLIKIAAENKQISGFEGFSPDDLVNAPTRFTTFLSNIISGLTIFAALGFILYFLVGALTWITSGGNPQQLDKAKNQVSAALIGFVIVVLTIPVSFIIGKIFGLDILNPEGFIELIKPK